MLIGPGTRPVFPSPPDRTEGLEGIYRYIEDLESVFGFNHANIVLNSFGLIGVRGLSSMGTTSNNFVKSLDISSVCTITWTFSNLEADATYMLFVSTFPTNLGMAATRNTTGVDFTFGPKTPSGMLLNVLLLR